MSELDRLLAAARAAEPDPLAQRDADAIVHAARASAGSPSVERRAEADRRVQADHAPAGAPSLERTLDHARRAEPDPLSDRALRSMAQRAAMTGRARHRGWTRRRVTLVSALAATAAAAAVTLMVLRGPFGAERVDALATAGEAPSAGAPARGEADDRIEPAPVTTEPLAVDEATDLALPTGDRLVAASGARFHVELPAPRVRRVRLGGGSMLFDVRPLEGGRFSVSTPTARVDVLGTVFSVEATERATTVWVYEGRVRVRGPGGARVVEAGGVVHLGAGAPGADAHASRGREAAARRSRAAVVASPTPERAGGAPATRAAHVRGERATATRTEVTRDAPTALGEATRPSGERATVIAPRTPDAASEEPATRATLGDDGRAPVAASRPAVAEREPTRAAEAAPEATPAEVRALVASGDAARALAIIEQTIARGERDPWRMLEGDALRVLGRSEQAAAAYARAASELPPPRREQAGFLEARLRAGPLRDDDGALRALHTAGVTAPGSVLRERGLALEVQLLTRLGRDREASTIAAEYLRAYPEGPEVESMRARAGER